MFSNLPIWFRFILYVSYKKSPIVLWVVWVKSIKKYFVTNIDKYKNTMQHSAKNSEVDTYLEKPCFFMIKFRSSEKAKKCWKIIPICFHVIYILRSSKKKVGDVFKPCGLLTILELKKGTWRLLSISVFFCKVSRYPSN